MEFLEVEDLTNSTSFRLLKELRHDEIIYFLQDEFRRRNWIIQLFFALNIFILVTMIVLGIKDVLNEVIGFWSMIGLIILGMLNTILLIPVHECIHGIAYWLVGAKKISFGANWRMFYFYAVADNFVIDRKRFFVVALAPFIVISLVLLFFVLEGNPEIKWLALSVLFIHTTACAGDIGILSYYQQHRHKELYTFDDVQKKTSYIYERVEESNIDEEF